MQTTKLTRKANQNETKELKRTKKHKPKTKLKQNESHKNKKETAGTYTISSARITQEKAGKLYFRRKITEKAHFRRTERPKNVKRIAFRAEKRENTIFARVARGGNWKERVFLWREIDEDSRAKRAKKCFWGPF